MNGVSWLLAPLLFQAQGPAADSPRRPGRGGFGGPIVLNPNDVQAYPEPPEGINADRPGIPHGRLEMIEYDSKSVGTRRKMQVYTPPGYSRNRKYPVLYLLHGIGGDETEWVRFAKPHLLMDILLADKKAVPMILVLPNGRAQKNDRAEGNLFAAAARQKLKLLWLSCGKKDGLLRISQGVHVYLNENDVPHVWNVDGHGHDPTHWRNNLYYFLQRLFR